MSSPSPIDPSRSSPLPSAGLVRSSEAHAHGDVDSRVLDAFSRSMPLSDSELNSSKTPPSLTGRVSPLPSGLKDAANEVGSVGAKVLSRSAEGPVEAIPSVAGANEVDEVEVSGELAPAAEMQIKSKGSAAPKGKPDLHLYTVGGLGVVSDYRSAINREIKAGYEYLADKFCLGMNFEDTALKHVFEISLTKNAIKLVKDNGEITVINLTEDAIRDFLLNNGYDDETLQDGALIQEILGKYKNLKKQVIEKASIDETRLAKFSKGDFKTNSFSMSSAPVEVHGKLFNNKWGLIGFTVEKRLSKLKKSIDEVFAEKDLTPKDLLVAYSKPEVKDAVSQFMDAEASFSKKMQEALENRKIVLEREIVKEKTLLNYEQSELLKKQLQEVESALSKLQNIDYFALTIGVCVKELLKTASNEAERKKILEEVKQALNSFMMSRHLSSKWASMFGKSYAAKKHKQTYNQTVEFNNYIVDAISLAIDDPSECEKYRFENSTTPLIPLSVEDHLMSVVGDKFVNRTAANAPSGFELESVGLDKAFHLTGENAKIKIS